MPADPLVALRDPLRLRTLRATGLLDTPREDAFDRLSRLAARLLKAPVALVSLLGNAELRACLWMPTLVATRCNPWLRAYYQRLVARGKPRKLAMVAAMRKLLAAIYSVAKSRRPFVPLLQA